MSRDLESEPHQLIGKSLPALKIKNQEDELIELKKLFSEGWGVLYFYPKDDTPGCTQEACDFRDAISSLKKLNVKVYGVSPDSPQKHQKFILKHELNFDLLADEDKKLCEAMKVWKLKKFMGREYMGVERTSFLLRNGKIVFAWQPVKVKDHVASIIKKIKELK